MKKLLPGFTAILFTEPESRLDGFAHASLVAHVAKHFFVGAGPSVTVNLSRSPGMEGDYNIGFNSTLGGWI